MNFKNKLRTSARESMDSPSQIVNRYLKDVATTSAPQLPNKSACRMIVQRVKNKGLPKISQTINEFHVPQYLAKSNGKQFCLFNIHVTMKVLRFLVLKLMLSV